MGDGQGLEEDAVPDSPLHDGQQGFSFHIKAALQGMCGILTL